MQRTYWAALRWFHKFCTVCTVGNPFPVTEQLLCHFMAQLADQGLAPQTIKLHLAGVRNMQISLVLPDPRQQSALSTLQSVQRLAYTKHEHWRGIQLAFGFWSQHQFCCTSRQPYKQHITRRRDWYVSSHVMPFWGFSILENCSWHQLDSSDQPSIWLGGCGSGQPSQPLNTSNPPQKV